MAPQEQELANSRLPGDPGFAGSAPMFGMSEQGPADPSIPPTSSYASAGGGTDELPGMPGMDVDGQAMGFMEYLKSRVPKPGAPAPGSFGDKLQKAFDRFGAGMGDAAAANEGAVSGEGPRGAIARVERARQQRLLAENKDAREAEEFRQRSALNNIQMAVHIQQLQKGSQEIRDKVFSMNAETSRAREADGWHVEHNVSETEARHRISSFQDPDKLGRHYTDLYEFVPVKYQEINGKQTPIYDVIEKTARKVTPSRQEAQDIAEGGGPNLITKNSKGEEVITPVDNVQLTAMRLAAQRRHDAVKQLEQSTGNRISEENLRSGQAAFASKDVQDALQYDQSNKVLSLTAATKDLAHKIKVEQAHVAALQGKPPEDMTPEDQKALATFMQQHSKGDVQQAIQESQHYIDQYTKAMGNISTALQYGTTEQDRKDAETIIRDREKEAHDVEVEKTQLMTAQAKQKEAEAAAKRADNMAQQNPYENDPRAEGLVGDDYLEFLKQNRPDDYYTVRKFGQGEDVLSGRIGKDALKLRHMMNRAYPDMKPYAAKEWPTAWKEYMVNGKNAQGMIAYNTLFRHMAELYDVTSKGSLMPWTKDFADRQALIGHVKEEIGKAYSAGVMTESDKQELEEKVLDPKLWHWGFSPEKMKERLKVAMRAGMDRVDAVQHEFDSAKPDKHIETPTLLSHQAKTALDYVLSDGKSAKPQSYQPGDEVSPAARENLGQAKSSQGYKKPEGDKQAPVPPGPPGSSVVRDKNGNFWGYQLQDGSFKKGGSQ